MTSRAREKRLAELNANPPPWGKIEHLGTTPFGPALAVERFRFGNGLELLFLEDRSAPVVAYHTWFRVGSRHEREGKTGLAHFFEHLMFRETENLPEGEFDRKLEEAGAESNAATWLDWTHYNIAVPKDQMPLVVTLEAERMSRLVLGDEQVKSEKEVVANERRYRVDDDVENAVSEQLWSMAYTEHAYHWPTIGWMRDIDEYSSEDCRAFYKTFYAPNNATVVVVGDVTEAALLTKMQKAYGDTPPSELPIEDVKPEPPQVEERRAEVEKPTATQKLTMGYKSPALGDFDHPALAILAEVLFGGRASRLHEELVRKREIATDVRVFVGLFRDPSLMEIYASARGEHTAEELLSVIETELERVKNEPVSKEEIDRARARMELGLLAGLDTVDGKASTIGFYDTVLARPASAFERLEAYGRVTPSDLLRVARRYLVNSRRTVIFVRPNAQTPEREAAE